MKKFLKTVSVLLTVAIMATFAVIPGSAAEIELTAGSSISTATSVVFGTTYNDSITASSTKDFYSLELLSSGKITLSFSGEIAAVDLYLYDGNGNQLWDNCYVNANSASGMISYSKSFDLTKGTYYFGVIKDYNSTGNYSFSFNFASAGESFTETGTGVDNAISTANSIAFNKTYKGQIALNDEKDFYKIDLTSSGKLTLNFNAQINAADLYLFDSTGKEIWKNYSLTANSSTGEIAYSVALNLTKDTYYLDIVKDYKSTGNYSFSTSFVSANESFDETGSGVNNTMDTSNTISLGTVYIGQIALVDEKDFYKFSLSSANSITLNFNAKMNNVDLYIYDSTGKEVWKNYNLYASGNSGEIAYSTKIDLSQGTYYLGVIKDSYTGTYDFSISVSGSVVTPPTATKTLSSITVDTLPTKVNYTVGEELDTTGMVVKAKYSDGTSAVVTGYTTYGFDSSKAGTSTVRVSYSEGGVTKVTAYSIVINEAIDQTPDDSNSSFSFDAIIQFFDSILAFFANILQFFIDLFSSLA